MFKPFHKALIEWNIAYFGYAQVRIGELEKDLKNIQMMDKSNRVAEMMVERELKK